MAKSHKGNKHKTTTKQLREREQQALERQRQVEAKQERTAFLKRVGIVVVCVILALALSLPTMGLLVLGGGA